MFVLVIGLPQAAWSIQISAPNGLQHIGEKLNLSATISGVPNGALSQLRSSCLKARVLSGLEVTSAGQPRVIDPDVLVQFQPTIHQGGLIELRSRKIMDDAVVNVQLTSDCPLVAFSIQWTVILELSNEEPPTSAASNILNDDQVQAAQYFSFKHSSSLTDSKSASPPIALKTPARFGTTVHQGNVDQSSGLAKLETANAVGQTPVVNSPESKDLADSIEKPIEVAALNSDLSVHGLVESRPRDSTHAHDDSMGHVTGSESYFSVGYLNTFIMMIGIVLLAMLFWLANRKKLFGAPFHHHLKGELPSKFNDKPLVKQAIESAPADAEQETPPDRSNQVLPEGRFIETLIGEHKATAEDEDLNSLFALTSKPEGGENISIKASLDAIRRADNVAWNLPPEYQDMIQERNAKLAVCRTPETLILKCQLGLIELAYQEAMRGHALSEDICSDLIDLVLGRFVEPSDFSSCLTVPDLISSYLQNKRYEVAGPDNRLRFEDNLRALTHIVRDAYFCFHLSQWQELVDGNIGTH